MREILLARVVWLASVVPDSHNAKDIYSSWHFEQRLLRRIMKSELAVCQFAEVLYKGEQNGLLSVPFHFHSPVIQWSLCWGDLPFISVLSHMCEWAGSWCLVQGRIKLFGAPRQWKHFRPLFQAVFLSGGYYPSDWVKHHASQPQDRNNYFILYIEFCINNKI